MLRNEFSVIFEEVIADLSSFTYDVVDGGLVSIESYVRGQGEIDACDGSTPTVSTNVPWPESWIELAKTIRELQRPTAWEIVA